MMYNLDNFAAQVNPPSPQEFSRRVRRIQAAQALKAGEPLADPNSGERHKRTLLEWIARFFGQQRAA